ncbi:UNVERIFIED_CONTAM: hypothetical protein Cloal_3547 [Acetivibrio alkalicellulosi]
MRKVLIIDTSILCVYLKVPSMDDCGLNGDKWNYSRVNEKITKEINEKSLLVLPMATLIEAGNHIAQANGDRYKIASDLAGIIVKVADEEEPWAAFTSQSKLWDEESLKKLAASWPTLAVSRISIGDATIKDVAEYYSSAGYQVEILTGDIGLKSYEPISHISTPRRKKNRN